MGASLGNYDSLRGPPAETRKRRIEGLIHQLVSAGQIARPNPHKLTHKRVGRSFVAPLRRLIFGTFSVGAVGRHHDDLGTGNDMAGHHGAHAIGKDGGLV